MECRLFSNKPVISHFLIMGDSLSDRGTLAQRYLCGIIPLAALSGLTGKSPIGRFSNGFVWSDAISATFASKFLINANKHSYYKLKHFHFDSTDKANAIITKEKTERNADQLAAFHQDSTDIADNVITNRHFQNKIKNSYTLNNDLYVRFNGRDFVRSYDEGGLTSNNYKWMPAKNLKLFFARLLLTNLEEERQRIISRDDSTVISHTQKEHTLVIEWSGANDLITVNAEPTRAIADIAISGRIQNIQELAKSGYHHFIMFNLPDLSLTPRFQNLTGTKGSEERNKLQNTCVYFNEQLDRRCSQLQNQLPRCTITIFDTNTLFSEVYLDSKNPTNHSTGIFDKDKLTIPFVDSKDFKISNGLSPSDGYMFWNDIHPSADTHAIIADRFYQTYKGCYLFNAPKAESAKALLQRFETKYNRKYSRRQQKCMNLFTHHTPPDIDYSNPTRSLEELVGLAGSKHNRHIRSIMKELMWLDEKGNINLEINAPKQTHLKII